MEEDIKYSYYDELVAKGLEEIMNTVTEGNKLTLTNFKVSDKGDLFVLELIKMCKFWGKESCVDAGAINPITYRLKSYLFEGVKREQPDEKTLIDAEFILANLRLREDLEDDTIFHNIYDEYYKPAPFKIRARIKFNTFCENIKGKIEEKKLARKEKTPKDEEMY